MRRPRAALDDLDDEVRDERRRRSRPAAAGAWAASSIADLDDDEPDWASQQGDDAPGRAAGRGRRAATAGP